MSYTSFLVVIGLLITATASASKSLTICSTTCVISTRPALSVSIIVGVRSISTTKLSTPWPYVFRGALVCQMTLRTGRSLSARNERHGPMPDPVVTTTTRLNSLIT
ncbi:hypothetical protein V1511DRAFT_131572 [Dipodascopsis uninucleata]